MQLPYLSEAWLGAVDAALDRHDRLRAQAASCALGVTQVVTGGAEPLVYHFTSHGGAARVGWGPAEPEDVRVVTDRAVAASIGAGRTNAAEAFITGAVVVTGDRSRLVDGRELLAAFDATMAEVATRTRFDDA